MQSSIWVSCTVVLFSATYNYQFECHALSFVLVPCAGIVFSAMSSNPFYRVNGRRNDETSRLEVDNKRTPARGSSVVFLLLLLLFFPMACTWGSWCRLSLFLALSLCLFVTSKIIARKRIIMQLHDVHTQKKEMLVTLTEWHTEYNKTNTMCRCTRLHPQPPPTSPHPTSAQLPPTSSLMNSLTVTSFKGYQDLCDRLHCVCWLIGWFLLLNVHGGEKVC